jgi:tetratricopeptide (TPR) repeat protein
MVSKRLKQGAAQKRVWRSKSTAALSLFVLALLVRGVYLFDSRDNPTFQTPIVDSQTYDGLARSLAAGRPVTSELFWQPVFYPLFLGLVYAAGSSAIVWAKIIQAILGAFTVLLAYRLAQKVFGQAEAVAAGLVTAIYMPLVFYETELLASGWAAFWAVALVLLFLEARKKPEPLVCLALGAVGALSILTRPEFLPVLGASCLWLLFVWARERRGAARAGSRFALVAVGFLLIAGPAGVWSRHVLGRTTILPTSGGINLFIGNNPDYERTITVRPGLDWRELTAAPARQGIVDDLGMQRYFLDRTREFVTAQPLAFLKGLAHKTAQFFSSREIPRNTDIYLFGKWSLTLRWLVWKAGPFGFPFGLLLPAAFLGLAFALRPLPGPLLLTLVLYPASMILVFVSSRYRVPLVPLLSVLAAGGIGAVWKMKQERRWKRLALASALALAVVAASSLPGPFPEERLDYEAELYYGLGTTFEKRGQNEEAKAAYNKTLELKDDYAEAHYNLANILDAEGDLQAALQHYARAVQMRPDSVEIRNNFGAALKSDGRIDQAVAQWEEAVRLAPSDPFAYFNLALALAEQGKYDQSSAYAKEALRQRPDWAELHVGLGQRLLQRGEVDMAREQFEEALRIRPAYADAHSGLGIALGNKGELDQAIAHFRQAIALDPRHVEALYNLGYALDLQGKWAEAIAQLERLLQIDPAHAQARRQLEWSRAQQQQDR